MRSGASERIANELKLKLGLRLSLRTVRNTLGRKRQTERHSAMGHFRSENESDRGFCHLYIRVLPFAGRNAGIDCRVDEGLRAPICRLMISSYVPASGDARCNGFDRILILYRRRPEGVTILNDSLRFTLPWANVARTSAR
jgi:hypothetical protein